MSAPIRELTTDEIDAYQRDGVVPLRQILPLGWVEELRSAMDEVFDRETDVDRGALASGRSTKGARGDMVQGMLKLLETTDAPDQLAIEAGHVPTGRSIVETDACSWHDDLRGLYASGPLPHIVAALTDSVKVNLYSDQLFLKEPGSSVRTPWHQDKPFWLLQGTKVAVCWVPVDVVGLDNGAMGYVRGSHEWGITYKPSDFVTSTGSSTIPGLQFDDLTDLPPIDANPGDYDIVRFEAEPGDVIVHHWMTLHGSTGNISANRTRRAASVRFAGDDVTYYHRPSSPDPFRHTVSLADGDDLSNEPRFPLVWGQPGR